MNREPHVVKVVELSVHCSDGDLRVWMRRNGSDVIQADTPFFVTVGGYEADVRELWEVPEIVDLCKRVIETGMVSFLAVNIGDERIPELWGAFDVYATANNIFYRPGQPEFPAHAEINRKAFERFRAVLEEANARARLVLSA